MDPSQSNCETSNTQFSETQPNNRGKTKWDDYVFAVKTIEECEEIFESCCEKRIEELAESKNKLSILRSCIELLNRLEGTTHNLFAGRVLIFLARVIPFYDESGLNKRSDFSTRELPESVTSNLKLISEKNADKDVQRSQHEDMEEGETLSDDESDATTPKQLDPNRMYERFWKVQQLIIQPNQLYDETNWYTFRVHVDGLVSYFEANPATCEVWKLVDNYMTEHKSFLLQLKDLNMRRCFLVQLQIVLQYLRLPRDTKSDNLTLDKSKFLWISVTSKRIFNLLGPKGSRDFSGYIHQVLNYEELWNEWKIIEPKCRDPGERDKADEDEDEIINMGSTYRKRRKISDELKSAKVYNRHVIGSLQMSNLWNERPNQVFDSKPDLAKYLKVPQGEEAEKYFKKDDVSFKILRLSRKNQYFFVPTITVIQSLDNYLVALANRFEDSSSR